MRKIFKNAWNIIRKNFISFILFEFVYRLTTVLILINVLKLAMDFSLKQNNFSYLTAENYIEYLRNPFTIIGLCFTAVLGLFFMLIEVSSIFVCFQFSYNHKYIFTTDMLILGIGRTWSFLKRSKVIWILCILLAAPFLCLHLFLRNFDYVKLIHYTARVIYELIDNKILFLAAITLFLVVSFLSMFTLPYCLLNRKKSIKALFNSMKLLLKHMRTVFGSLLIGNIAAGIFNYLLYVLVLAMAAVFMWLTKDSIFVLGAVLSVSGKIRMVMGVMCGAIGLTVNLVLIYSMYMEFVGEKEYKESRISAKDKSFFLMRVKERKLTVLAGLIILALESGYLINLFHNDNRISENILNSTKITAHRGGAQLAPENTLAAIEKSIETLSDYAEIDIQETKDGELILMHDNNLKRVTGFYGNVWEVDFEEVRQQRVISNIKNEFQNERVPTLKEVLETCKNRLNLNIEVKCNGYNEGIIKKVVDLVEEMDFEDQCMITSMNYKYLKEVKELNPEIRTGYIMTMTYGSVSNIEAADFFSVKWTYINENFIKEAHAIGKEVHAWTVNSRGTLERMKILSVDNVITDNPSLAREVMELKPHNASFIDILRHIFK
jgi:glycerophosphoryl diester phosphodiesterase